MSLFGAIQLGANTLRAMQIGLQVTGNNIANANTPGYVRQEVSYSPAPIQQQGRLVLGLGVEVDSIVQKIDKFVQERLVGARGDRASAETQEGTYRELEVLLGELATEGDLSGSLTEFFNSIDEVLKDPANAATRNLVVLNGQALALDINSLSSQATTMRQELNSRVIDLSDSVNELAEEVRRLNIQIATVEGGTGSASDAGALRVNRQVAIDKLSELIGVQATEQLSGSVNIAIGGEFLVFEGQRRIVDIRNEVDNGVAVATLQFTDTNSTIDTSAGELNGLYASRDDIVGGFVSSLDDIAATLSYEFNKLYSQGQGLVGFDSLTSLELVNDSSAALDAAGLDFSPVNGSFDLLVQNSNSGLTKTHTIFVDLDGLDDDTSLDDLASQLDAIDGITASVSLVGELQIASESPETQFAFSRDSSGLLAALGLNTFFTGSSARELGVNDGLKGIANAGKLAVSLGGIGEDATNAERLASFLTRSLESEGNATFEDIYNQLVNDVTQGSSLSQSVAEGYRIFEGTLVGQQQAVSGVSLDEEAIKMISMQQIYQASARYIQIVTEMLEILVNL